MARIKDLKRMCKSFKDNCDGCPLHSKIDNVCLMLTLERLPDNADEIVDKWVSEHPAAKEFVDKVRKLADEYNVNYFVVTDGYSSISNNGNGAVRNARKAHMKWEKEYGFETEEHFAKTYLQDFFEKFPKAPKEEEGAPKICPHQIYPEISADDRCPEDCLRCWNQEMKN